MNPQTLLICTLFMLTSCNNGRRQFHDRFDYEIGDPKVHGEIITVVGGDNAEFIFDQKYMAMKKENSILVYKKSFVREFETIDVPFIIGIIGPEVNTPSSATNSVFHQ